MHKQTDMSGGRQISRAPCPHGMHPLECAPCVALEAAAPTDVIDVEGLPDAPVPPDSKRKRLQTQPGDIDALVAQIDNVHAQKASAVAKRLHVPRLANPVYVQSSGGKAHAEGGQLQAGGAASAAATSQDCERAWLKVVHGSELPEPKPEFWGRCGQRTDRNERMMQPVTELPVCQPQAEYIPPGDHDADPFVGEHVNLHRPYNNQPVQMEWALVRRYA